MTESRVPLAPGAIIGGRFEITGAPRRGAFGLTYPAHDRRMDGAVALKEYFPGDATRLPTGDIQLGRGDFALDGAVFLREAASLSNCPAHAAIAKFVAADVQHRTGYLALEWVDGETLADRTDADDGVVRVWFVQLLDAVLALGNARLVHHDIKPANIMIRANGSAVLVDFGAGQILSRTGYFDSTLATFSPAYAPPEAFMPDYVPGPWTDIFGLCASFYEKVGGCPPVRAIRNGAAWILDGLEVPLRIRQLKGDDALRGRDPALLDAIDMGLSADLLSRPRDLGAFIKQLGLDPAELSTILPDAPSASRDTGVAVDAATTTTIFRARRESARGEMPERHQTAIIQSLDSARFQESAFQTRGGDALDNSVEQKVALARTEVFLNLMFGREIVIPAGHVADSRAVVEIVGEVIEIYQNGFQQRIDVACARHGLPAWRPFRLAVEDPLNRDGYTGFVQTYRYTGASLPVLQAAGQYDGENKEQAKREKLEAIRSAYLDRRFDDLDKEVFPGFGAYAARIGRYFSDDASQFPIDLRPIESIATYASVFRAHLANDYVAGAGASEAKASLDWVTKIEADLKQFKDAGEAGATGFRGNWYLFAQGFKDVWPLARGYLDAKLYIEMAAKYDIDHPVLVSQAYEYGQFDHSLVLGPRFGIGVVEGLSRDPGLTELTASLSARLPWQAVFELFTQDDFLESLGRLNRGYRSGNPAFYRDSIIGHGEMLADRLDPVRLETATGRLIVAPSDDDRARLTFDSYDAALAAIENEAEMREIARSINVGLQSGAFDAAGVSLLPLRAALRDSAGQDSPIVHYFVKPIRLRHILPAAR